MSEGGTSLEALGWPAARLGEAVVELAQHSGLSQPTPGLPTRSCPVRKGGADLNRWLAHTCDELGLEAEPVRSRYAGVEMMIRGMAPALVRLGGSGERLWLVLVRGGRRRVVVLAADRSLRRLAVSALRQSLCRSLEEPLAAEVEELLQSASVPRRRWCRGRHAVLRQRLAASWVEGGWLLRRAVGASWREDLKRTGATRRVALLASCHAAYYGLWILSWWTIGYGALRGRLDAGWLVAWVLLISSLIPFRLAAVWLQGRIAISVGGLLKQRLLDGALGLSPESIRHQGIGQLLGRVLECEAVEFLALGGGFALLTSTIELVAAAVVLSAGAAGVLLVLMLAVWLSLVAAWARGYRRRLFEWTRGRLELTHELIEKLSGQRTRLVQEAPDQWHGHEDQELAAYLERSERLDAGSARFRALVARGWLVLGLVTMAPAFVLGVGSQAKLAISLGGLLLAYRGFRGLGIGLEQLLSASVAWAGVRELFQAVSSADRLEPSASAFDLPGVGPDDRAGAESLIEMRDLSFAFGGRRASVIDRCDLDIRPGERILLQGPSGGGKSTLVSLLAGLRRPRSGRLLVCGSDGTAMPQRALRERVATVPQFHENHVLTETLAFNLLMGRCWPPSRDDLREAEEIVRALGLGPLVDRMPAGLFQRVGETGWQLSHGEKSRLFIARALLQRADLVILDESFGALDPECLGRALECVVERSPTLMVVAHP